MCGRYTLRTKLNALLSQFAAELADPIDYRPRYNIAPTQSVLAVRQPEQVAKRELVALRWGLIPVWAKDRPALYAVAPAFPAAGSLNHRHQKRPDILRQLGQLSGRYAKWLP